MTTINEILQFAGDPAANVELQADYAADSSTTLGFQSGIAQSAKLNKVWRQSSFIAAGIAEVIAQQGIDVPDDGDLENLVNNISALFAKVRVVDRISALRDLLKTGSPSAFVTGYYESSDGGGGNYILDPSDTTSADNGGTIIVADDGGRWKLSFTGMISAKQFGSKGDGITDDTSTLQNAIDWCNSKNTTLFVQSGNYLFSSLTVNCSIKGEGAPLNNAGTVFKWDGTGTVLFNTPTYISGWCFENFTIDASGFSNACQMWTWDHGINGQYFNNIKWKGYHTGPSFGGTYANQDGLYVVTGNVIGPVKYDFSNNIFIGCQWQRCRNGVTASADPSLQGPGNENTFIGCFSWVNGWAVKLFGASNTMQNFEVNTEAGHHAFVQSGAFASNWVYLTCEFDQATFGDGNQPIYADTVGAFNICTVFGGQLFPAEDSSGTNSLVKDAGATGGKVFRYLASGINNYSSNDLWVDNIILGQALGGSKELYEETSITPTFTGLTENPGSGTITKTGDFCRIGRMVFWEVTIHVAGGATTSSVGGTTYLNDLPYNIIGPGAICNTVNNNTIVNYGTGSGAVGTKHMFLPTWTTVADSITLSGFYPTDGT